MGAKISSVPIEERLLAKRKIDPVTGCWNWTGATRGGGYGEIGFRGHNMSVHRISMEIYGGGLSHSEFVCHKCDNPRCFNPDRLFKGDNSANMRDSVAKKRHCHSKKTHCIRGHALIGRNIYPYRMKTTGGIYRCCRVCQLLLRKQNRSQINERRRQLLSEKKKRAYGNNNRNSD